LLGEEREAKRRKARPAENGHFSLFNFPLIEYMKHLRRTSRMQQVVGSVCGVASKAEASRSQCYFRALRMSLGREKYLEGSLLRRDGPAFDLGFWKTNGDFFQEEVEPRLCPCAFVWPVAEEKRNPFIMLSLLLPKLPGMVASLRD
jgi:hypothetical protein